MAELRAAGKCFKCKEVGHLSRNCPTTNTMKGSTSKPPGVSSFSIQMDLINDQEDHGEILESMPVGMISLADAAESGMERQADSDWRKEFPLWRWPQGIACRKISNNLFLMAEYLLVACQPYPGDLLFQVDEIECHPSARFSVTELNESLYQIVDKFVDFSVEIQKSLLANTKFNLCHWYTKRRVQVLNLRDTFKSAYLSPMGDPICDVTQHLLRQGINSHFPNADPTTDSEDQFFVFQKDFGSTIIVIIDEDLDVRLEID